MKTAKRLAILAIAATGVFAHCFAASYIDVMITAGPPVIRGAHYGYRTPGEGPGDDAFGNCLAWAKENRQAMMIMVAKNNCATCSAIAEMINMGRRGLSGVYAWKGHLCTYFRISDNLSSPKACVDAYEFCKNEIKATNPCHQLCLWGMYPDGTVYTEFRNCPSVYENFGSTYRAMVDRFYNNYDKHKYLPPKANAKFETEDGTLQALADTAQVYVPLARTNGVEAAETNSIAVTYADGTKATNRVEWTAGSGRTEVAVLKPGSGWGETGANTVLELLNTNGVSVATNRITVVSATNSLLNPAVGEPMQGRWTLLRDGSVGLTDALAAQNLYVATNAPVSAESVTNFTFEATNVTKTVCVPGLDGFTNETDMAVMNAQKDGCGIAMNGEVAKELPDSATLVTNSYLIVREVVTNYVAEASGGETGGGETEPGFSETVAFKNVFRGLDAEGNRNGTVVELPFEVAASIGELKWSAEEAEAAVTNEPRKVAISAIATDEYPAGTETTNRWYCKVEVVAAVVDRDCPAVAATNVASGTHTAEWIDAAQTAVAFDGGRVEDYAEMNVARSGQATVESTNVVWTVLANEASETETTNVVEWSASFPATNYTYSVVKKHYGAEEAKAMALKATGGAVWDPRMADFAAKCETESFKAWCEANSVVCVVEDRKDSVTGASLFTHAKAANGRRGTSFLSQNGLAEDAAGSAQGTDFKIEIFCPAGKVDEEGNPVYENGVQTMEIRSLGEVTEAANQERALEEILKDAIDIAVSDPTEGGNNSPETTKLEVKFGAEDGTRQTMNLIDVVDVFRLTGEYKNNAVAFGAYTNGIAVADGTPVALEIVRRDGAAIAPRVAGVWVFGDEDEEVFVKAALTGGEPVEYAVKAFAAPENEGTISFGGEKASVTENSAEGVEGVLEFDRTENGTNWFNIVVNRTAGLTGAIEAEVVLDDSAVPEEERDRYFFEAGQTVKWADLDAGKKTARIGLVDDAIWYGKADLTIRLMKKSATAGETPVCVSEMKLEYLDDETATVGHLAMVEAGVTPSGDGRTYVREGETIKVKVAREGGSCSDLKGWLKANVAGTVIEPGEFTWVEKSKVLTNEFAVTAPSVGTKQYVDLTLTLNGDAVDAKRKTFPYRVLPADAPGWSEEEGAAGGDAIEVSWKAVQYVQFAKSVKLAADGVEIVSISKIGGSVPAGLKVAKADGAIEVSGVPTGSGNAKAVYWAKAKKADGAQIFTMPVTMNIAVSALKDENPNFSAAMNWSGIILAEPAADAETKPRLAGLLDLSVRPNGKTSAKFRTAGGKTVSLSANGLGGIGGDGTVELAAERKVSGVAYSLKAAVAADGAVEVEVRADGAVVAKGSVVAGATPWSATKKVEDIADVTTLAFRQSADAQTLCPGDATVVLRMGASSAKRGAATFAANLPNGRAVSGTAYAEWTAEGAQGARLCILSASTTDTLAASLKFAEKVPAADDTAGAWLAHRETKFASLSYGADLEFAAGAEWVRGKTDPQELAFALADGGDKLEWTVETDGEKIAVRPNEAGRLKLSLNRATGLVVGAANGATIRGVAVKGDAGMEIFGAWSRTAREEAERDDGKKFMRSVKAGGAVAGTVPAADGDGN